MRDPLNFFEPFEQLPTGHENQLTRAFLVVLRHSLPTGVARFRRRTL